MTQPTKPPSLSLIVAVYQRADFLEKVFVSLLNQTMQDFEILVADDGSGPEVRAVIEEYQEKFRHAIRHVWHEDDGFRKTIIVNRAVTEAAGDYLVFIDGDCILHHRFIERHYRRRRPGLVLSGRRVMMDRELSERITLGDIRTRRVEQPSFWWNNCPPHDRRRGIYTPALYLVRNLFRTSYEILGSNFSAHKNDFYRVNGYDERIIGRGLEDNNLCMRFINSKIKIHCLAHEALQYHLYHRSDPIPHSSNVVAEFRDTQAARTPHGIVKE